MPSMDEYCVQLKQAVVDYNRDQAVAIAQTIVDQGLDAQKAVFDGLIAGMQVVGKYYEDQYYFVPEMLMCAQALYSALDILKPHMPQTDLGLKGQVVMGVVQGDVHDIGKNIVKLMFEVAGFEVKDLGRDVPLDDFVREQLSSDADMVCLSAMMTTTMTGMREVIRKIKEKNPKCRIMIGGAPVTEELASKWGADGYAPDANNALREAIAMVSSLHEMYQQAQARD
ncbi:MAG: corrinoid protein [Thermaerobacter sp.]|nr:corrinoid protein [Thermaerobacter sp.]